MLTGPLPATCATVRNGTQCRYSAPRARKTALSIELRTLIGLLFCVILLVQGCAAQLPVQVDRTASSAFDNAVQTGIGRLAIEAAQRHAGASGFLIQDTGREAFLQRAALIEAAERSIDAQYYIWNSDASGRYLARRLLLAADRGVRVRLLLDDVNVAGRDSVLNALDSHANIEIRLYNPFATRSGMGKALEAVTDFQRINRRMHNKTFVVDGAFGIVGGRNIGDEYFGMHPEMNFRDRDLLAAGPAVREISRNFDAYWNSPAAWPVAALAGGSREPATVERAIRTARTDAADRTGLRYAPIQRADAARTEVRQWLGRMVWAPAEVVFSEPFAGAMPEGDVSSRAARRLGDLMRASRHEILMESAYFILGEPQLEGIAGLTGEGVTVRAITNSLASNDLTLNHAGYARGRRAMLASGMELYELRPDAEDCGRWLGGEAGCPGEVGLHAKTMVFDRAVLYVGSFNLNLRSIYLNGETLLVIHSPRLATRVAESIERSMQPGNSWRVVAAGEGGLQWIGRDGVHEHEPDAGFWRRFKAGWLRLLPLEKYY